MTLPVQPLLNIIRPYLDIGRPLLLATVTSVAAYTTSGPGFVRAVVDGVERQIIYRDAPAPAVGSTIQVVRMSAAATAPWLALPQAAAVTTMLVACAYDGNAGNNNGGPGLPDTDPYFFAIIARNTDGTWEKRAPHPFTKAMANTYVLETNSPAVKYWLGCPFLRQSGTRLFTFYQVNHDALTSTLAPHYMDAATPAFYSDDQGVTWGQITGLTGVRNIDVLADGALIAVGDDGDNLYYSTDNGDSWTLVPGGSAPASGPWHTVIADPVDADLVALSNYDGYYTARGLTTGLTVTGPMGPAMHVAGSTTLRPDQFPMAQWPARTPSGGATMARPDRYDLGVTARPDFMRQADPMGTGGAIMPVVFSDPTWYGYEYSRFWVIGSDLYRCEIDQGFTSSGEAYDAAHGGPSTLIWKSADDGLTWSRVLTPYDAALLGPAGQPWATGIGQIAQAADGTLYANTDSTYSGVSWYTDPYDSSSGTYSPGQRLIQSPDGGATWTDATGSLIADTGGDGAWYVLYWGGWVLV